MALLGCPTGHTASDPLHNSTTYSYNYFGDLVAVMDPLLNTSRFAPDSIGRRLSVTDALNETTSYQYDALDRATFVGFGTQPGPTYESQINYVYDGYDRLLAAADSVTGANLCPTVLTNATICHTYNDLTRTSTETTPQGTVTYTSDLAGLRSTMTVTGQPTVSDTFDFANLLTKISQATTPTATVTNFAYAAAI